MIFIKQNSGLIFFIALFVFSLLLYIISNINFSRKIKKGSVVKTKKGDFVQSYGEKVIADFLFDNNIEYIYDKPARFSFWQKVKIRPDFYLKNYDVYIEYWGLAGKEDYDNHSIWKKKLYKKYKKKLINLYSNQKKNIPAILKEDLDL